MSDKEKSLLVGTATQAASEPRKALTPWAWIPSLYIAEALPYSLVMTASLAMYTALGVPNNEMSRATSLLYLPWVIKGLWSPFLDIFRTKRWWVFFTEFLMGAGFLGVALSIPLPSFFQATLVFFWVLAFLSATHDAAADGFYLLGLEKRDQERFVGIRSTFYRLGNLCGQGLLVAFAGFAEKELHLATRQAWSTTFLLASALIVIVGCLHRALLPRPATDAPANVPTGRIWKEFWASLKSFTLKKRLLSVLVFLLLYRLAEAQLARLFVPFLMSPREVGGLGLSTEENGAIYGTVGVIAMIAGGILGGYAIAGKGLKFWLWPMACAIHLPNLVFVYLAHAQPLSRVVISALLAVEQFGYGFGFAAYMVYMMRIAKEDPQHETAHYALCTGFMALGMMLPGFFAGDLQMAFGFADFSVWIVLCTIPSFLAVALIQQRDRNLAAQSRTPAQ